MRLLIITQKVDADDDILGFFHRWLERFAATFGRLVVICLEEGTHHLPTSVRVLSLGKETARSRLKYLKRFFAYSLRERHTYEAVFVHMNQEYVLLAGLLWRLLGKKVVLWRNHPEGSFLTRVAVLLSHRVLCTSPFSFTARFRKTELMPAGIDTELFRPAPAPRRGDVLVLGRIAPIKRLELLIEALTILKAENFACRVHIVGEVLPEDNAYARRLQDGLRGAGLSDAVLFAGPVRWRETPALYNGYRVFVNCTPTGSFDKTILEAMACARPVLVSNRALRGVLPETMLFEEGDASDLAAKLESLLTLPAEVLGREVETLRAYVSDHQSLTQLAARLRTVFARV